MKQESVCAWCYYARMRRDICGTYCTGGFENSDGTCDHFVDWKALNRAKRTHGKQHVEEAIPC